MNRYVFIAAALSLLAAAPFVQAAENAANKADAERRLMENVAADEDGWSAQADDNNTAAQADDNNPSAAADMDASALDAPAAAPDYLDEQNPHESMRPPAPAKAIGGTKVE